MPRKKGSKSTVMISQHQLDMICGEQGLACVSRKWLRELGFDPDQNIASRSLGVHAVVGDDGRETWDFREADGTN